jgi:hypothetical protein
MGISQFNRNLTVYFSNTVKAIFSYNSAKHYEWFFTEMMGAGARDFLYARADFQWPAKVSRYCPWKANFFAINMQI